MKKGFYVVLAILLVGAFVLNLKKKEIPKKVETVKQQTQSVETTGLWLPDKESIVFINRLLFLEGEIKERLIRELEVETKKQKPEGLDIVKNDMWLSYIGKQLKKANLPLDLVYLPIIESSMNPTAISSAGAGGYWQWMPSTARKYGLKITPYIDERFDPIKSTDAAIKHLEDLVNIFDDWTASLGGYNMDPDALKEAMKEEGTINFYKLKTIPLETQRFLFRIMATKLIFENPEKYGFSRKNWLDDNAHDNWQILEISLIIEADSSLDKVVSEIKTDYPNLTINDFRRFNPQILGNFLPRGNYTVYILRTRNGTS